MEDRGREKGADRTPRFPSEVAWEGSATEPPAVQMRGGGPKKGLPAANRVSGLCLGPGAGV
jgi:hypothetical protein